MQKLHPLAFVKTKNWNSKMKMFQKFLWPFSPKRDLRDPQSQKKWVNELKTAEIKSIMYMEQNEGSFA